MIANRYELLGKEELGWICDFCGKKEISICYTVLDNKTGQTLRFGSTCIRKALGVPMKEIEAEKKANIAKIKDEYMPRIYALQDKGNEIADQWRKDNGKVVGSPPDNSEAGVFWDMADNLRIEMNGKVSAFMP